MRCTGQVPRVTCFRSASGQGLASVAIANLELFPPLSNGESNQSQELRGKLSCPPEERLQMTLMTKRAEVVLLEEDPQGKFEEKQLLGPPVVNALDHLRMKTAVV